MKRVEMKDEGQYYTFILLQKRSRQWSYNERLNWWFCGRVFLIWFYFIGIWIIQPKINEMVDLQP